MNQPDSVGVEDIDLAVLSDLIEPPGIRQFLDLTPVDPLRLPGQAQDLGELVELDLETELIPPLARVALLMPAFRQISATGIPSERRRETYPAPTFSGEMAFLSLSKPAKLRA
jgi:hypothetical protein